MHTLDIADVQNPGRGKIRDQPLGPQDLNSAGGEGSADKRPVGVDEAQDSVDREVVTDNPADDVDLREHAVNELGAVSDADYQPFHARTQDSAFDLQLGGGPCTAWRR